MSFSCGLVGLPNVGKSTVFNRLTNSSVPAHDYPFCTIDPNIGVAAVQDPRLLQLAALSRSKKIVPAYIRFVDIAGLIAGAHKGQGLGNMFLSHIRSVSAIAHVVRCFGELINPLADIADIHTELLLSDLEMIEKMQAKDKKGKDAALYQGLIAHLSQEQPARTFAGSRDLEHLNLLTNKKTFFILNVDDLNFRAHIIQDIRQTFSEPICVVTGNHEDLLSDVAATAMRVQNLITFFTTGETESRAWMIADNTPAYLAAGKIHTDFIKKFSRAQVASYEDYIGMDHNIKHQLQTKLRHENKNYVVKDGDVIHFLVRN